MKDKKKYLFDDPKNIKRVLHMFYGCCALLFVLDFVIHRHISHGWENLWGFYPLYGFVGCVILVFVATWMRTFLKRDESYYEKKDTKNRNDTNKKKEKLDDKTTTKAGEHHVDD
ncbi:MAG: hypothetical protein ACSHW0_08525 [Thalassotalea sp.]